MRYSKSHNLVSLSAQPETEVPSQLLTEIKAKIQTKHDIQHLDIYMDIAQPES